MSLIDSPARARPEDFSIMDPAVQSDPYAFYKTLRAQCPVYKVPETGIFIVSRYRDLKDVMSDPGTFSNVMERAGVLQGENARILVDKLEAEGWKPMPTLQRSDPPEHARYRKFVDRAFNMKQVRGLEDHMKTLVNTVIDKFIDRGECDFIEDFAFPFPGTIIAELVGLEAGDWPRYRAWADNILAYSTRVMTREEIEQAARTELEMQHHYVKVFEDRRRNPREDLISALVNPEEGEEPLTMQELQNIMNQLTAGGYETVPNALCHGMWIMIRHPQVVEELRADRSLVRDFINESLRWESPIQGHYRRAAKDTVLGGVEIPAGSMVNVRWGSANRDDTHFEQADVFDLHRGNAASHVGFGGGVHFCPGAVLARQEMTVAYNAILDRMDDIQLARPLPDPVHKPSLGFLTMKELHIRFKKRA